jgi:hypothetical protein
MGAQPSWVSKAPAVNHIASWETEEAVSARVVIDMGEHRCGSPNNINSSGKVVGKSPALQAVFEQVERVAPTNATVLIRGETGTGKELIAHAIHNTSSRGADHEALASIFSDPGKFYVADPYTFLFASLMVLIFGPGLFAVDTLIAKRVKESA